MKSFIRIFLLSCVVLTANEAQSQKLFSVGVKAGLNMSTQTVDDAADYSFTPGFQIGGFAQAKLASIAIQADILYSQQGSTVKAGDEKMKTTASYFNVPITIKYSIIPSLNLQVGPQVGFLSCVKSDYHPVTHQPFKEQHYTKAYKGTDFGVNVGVGWNSPVGLMIEARYYLGLSDISDYEGVESTKNRVIQLTVGYSLFKF
jgi:hypothetical protein